MKTYYFLCRIAIFSNHCLKNVFNFGHPNVGAEDAPDGQLDVPWMMEHYKQVLRLLPGNNSRKGVLAKKEAIAKKGEIAIKKSDC